MPFGLLGRGHEEETIKNAFGNYIPINNFISTPVSLYGSKGEPCGIRLSASLAILKVDQNSMAYGNLYCGDLIVELNGKNINNSQTFSTAVKKIMQQSRFEIKLRVLRPIVSLPMEPKRMPRAYEPIPGYTYHIGVMFMVIGCKLSLSIKTFNGKVYVTDIKPDTLSGMTFSIGDAVVDIDMTQVASVQETSDLLFTKLRSKGFVTILIEQPDTPITKAYVRAALLAEKTQLMDLPIPNDVQLICENEILRFKNNIKLAPKRKILKHNDAKKSRKTSRIKVNEKAEEIPVACDTNPQLLVKVPSAPLTANQYQPLNILNK